VRLIRLYDPGPLVADRELELGSLAAAHAARVLRVRVGDPLSVFDGTGQEHNAVVSGIRGGSVRVRLGAAVPQEAPARIAITLAQSIARTERMDYAIQKATELGVARIVPLIAEHGVVKLTPESRKSQHWRQVAISACEQCGRARIPELGAAISAVKFLTAPAEGTRVILTANGGTSVSQLPPSSSFTIAVGPEGGWSAAEQAAARAEPAWIPLKLGPRVLRTETAGPAAIAALQALFGDFRP
jgi:16S rRNA (uracil1498-N3)-methyltransferase